MTIKEAVIAAILDWSDDDNPPTMEDMRDLVNQLVDEAFMEVETAFEAAQDEE